MKDHTCALILGGYVNGYSIMQELYDNGVTDIVLFSTTREPGSYSNKIKKFVLIDKSPGTLQKELQALSAEYPYIVLFPTDDLQLENIYAIADKISDFCFIPFNRNNFSASLDKYTQYTWCDTLGVPRPKTIEIRTVEDIDTISNITFPILLKPKTRQDEKINIFRNLHLHDEHDLRTNTETIKNFVLAGVSFIASEIIPGDGSNIYAYVGYRSMEGRILNEWTGKKLSQYPDDFGIFSSASNLAPVEVLEQGKTLLNGMDLKGIAEPEFKYDCRDGKYKLMEINLRSMMWNRVGYLSGVNLHYTQYVDAIGGEVPSYRQEKTRDIHLVCLKHELSNLIRRKGYAGIFYHNMFGGDVTNIALFDIRDLRPFLVNCVDIIDEILSVGRKRLGI
jgi:predicted ATP-grasp superfamily ATP-dependent carboligase